MIVSQLWNDNTREDLRETLRKKILGEIRLANSDHDDILQTCCEIYIEDGCPEAEEDLFIRSAADELEQTSARLLAEQETWSLKTDCDRLDRIEADLRDRGILLWQVSPCCDTGTGAELPERIDEIDQQHPGLRERVRGVYLLHRSKHG